MTVGIIRNRKNTFPIQIIDILCQGKPQAYLITDIFEKNRSSIAGSFSGISIHYKSPQIPAIMRTSLVAIILAGIDLLAQFFS